MRLNEKVISRITGILITVVVLLVIANVATVYYFYTKNKLIKVDESANNLVNIKGEERNSPSATGSNIITKENQIVVNWQVDSKASTTLRRFLPPSIIDRIPTDSGLNYNNALDDGQVYHVVYLGKIEEGLYGGKDMYRIEIQEMGTTYYRVIKNGDQVIVLNNYSAPTDYYFKGIFIEDKNTEIVNLEPPQEISIPNSNFKLIQNTPSQSMFQYDLADLTPIFKSGDWQVYHQRQNGCFVVKALDGTDRNYYFDFLPPVKNANDSGVVYYTAATVSGITWNSGIASKDVYKVDRRSCFYGCYNYFDVRAADLQLSGEYQGQKIYELKDDKYEEANTGQAYLKIMYSEFDKTKISYIDFLTSHPIVFWQDPFGGYIALRNTKFDQFSMAECGKPVIYLYPEKTTDVSVQVAPTGGFTITEPAYNNGWKVKATPDSELYNYADKQTYPYLFWEGKGYNYQMPNAGFVVKKEKVEKFLVEKLAKLGLIQKEYDEFIEFWLPKMQAKPYYFITFVPQNDFDKIAPLNVNPKPDTIIRVFMDFQGLDNFVRVPEQKIVTPKRIGFTVVEWGGALHR